MADLEWGVDVGVGSLVWGEEVFSGDLEEGAFDSVVFDVAFSLEICDEVFAVIVG